MDKQKKEMTQEREATILEEYIDRTGEGNVVVQATREILQLRGQLIRWLRKPESEETPEALLECLGAMAVTLNLLEMIFGDTSEQEIAKLEQLEGLVQE